MTGEQALYIIDLYLIHYQETDDLAAFVALQSAREAIRQVNEGNHTFEEMVAWLQERKR